jgi:glycosyltransferase involved in cell wall biosynthesis
MTDLNKVLIAVSTFNQADYFLPKCLQTIQKQTYKDFICVVGDDRSTDNTKEVVKSLNDNRFIYHLTPRKYTLNSYFYNWCANHYKNEYYITCDADNFFFPDHIEKLLGGFTKGDYVCVYGYANNAVYGDDKRTVVGQYFRGEPWNINRYIFGTSYNNFIDMSDILFKREYFIGCGGYMEGPGFQDYSIMVRLAIKYNNRIGYVPEVLTLYSILPDSQSRTRDADRLAHMNIF